MLYTTPLKLEDSKTENCTYMRFCKLYRTNLCTQSGKKNLTVKLIYCELRVMPLLRYILSNVKFKLIIKIYFIVFKVVRGLLTPTISPIIHTFFIGCSWDRLQLSPRIFFYGFERLEMCSSKWQFGFRKQEKITWSHIW